MRTLVPLTRAELRERAGRTVVAREVPVMSVPADEGFWIGSGEQRRIWVQLVTPEESPARVESGARVSFRGELVAHGPDYAARVGIDAAGGAERLTEMGAHVIAEASRLTIRD